jgi:hypothetical protein
VFELCIFEPCRVPDRKRIVNVGFPRVLVCARGFTASYYVRRCPGMGKMLHGPDRQYGVVGVPCVDRWILIYPVSVSYEIRLLCCPGRPGAPATEKASERLGGATCTRIPHSEIHPRRPVEAHGGRSSASQVDQLYSRLKGSNAKTASPEATGRNRSDDRMARARDRLVDPPALSHL